MKTLILVRHAKSSWDNPDLADFERTLNKRGHRDASFMADVLAKHNIKPDLIITSPAVRALTTAQYFADALSYDKDRIITKELIYDRGPRQILFMLNELNNSENCVILFGHNPDLSSLSQFLCNFEKGNLPTCGIVCIDFQSDTWATVGDDKGTLRFFESPKMYFNKDK